MARGGISWEGVYAEYVTFASALTYADAANYVGKAVTADKDGVVVAHASASGKYFLGVVEAVERDGAMNIQIGRILEAPTASIVNADVGKQVVCDGTGGLKIVNPATAAEVAVARGNIIRVEADKVFVLV